MVEFSERLSAMKAKQEAADLKKKQEAEQAAEAARLEREVKRSELATERDTVMAEFVQAEQTANEAREAIAQADVFATEQGENLDPAAKAEIDAMKVEAGEAQQKFEELKTKMEALNAEISAFEESEQQEAQTEATEQAVQPEGSSVEKPKDNILSSPDSDTIESQEQETEIEKIEKEIEQLIQRKEEMGNKRKTLIQEVADIVEQELSRDEYKNLNSKTRGDIEKNLIQDARNTAHSGESYGVKYHIDANEQNYLPAEAWNALQTLNRGEAYEVKRDINIAFDRLKRERRIDEPNLLPEWKQVVAGIKSKVAEEFAKYPEIIRKAETEVRTKNNSYRKDMEKLAKISELVADKLKEFSDLLTPTRNLGRGISRLEKQKRDLSKNRTQSL